jgi:hypothetical protein
MDAESIAIISNMYWLNDSDTTNGGFIHAAGLEHVRSIAGLRRNRE